MIVNIQNFNIMKSIQRIVAASAFCVAAAFSMNSCGDFLNLPPLQDLEASGALSNAVGVETAISGTYQVIRNGSLYAGNLISMNELFGDYMQPRTENLDFQSSMISSRNLNFFNGTGRDSWGDAYAGINRANNVLAALPKVTDMTADNKRRIEGEALFLRGALYFTLVRWFGLPWGATPDNSHLGVVLRTQATTSPALESKKKRSTVAEVYAQIIADLRRAEELLPAPGGAGGRATKWSAAAFLARVYFQQANYPAAVEASSRVIGSNAYRLSATFEQFGETPKRNVEENILEVQNTSDQNTNGAGNAMRFDGFTAPFLSLSAAFRTVYNTFPATDKRKQLLFVADGGELYCKKYDAFIMNIPIVRLGEMYITRAEARAEAGDAAGALADLNVIRQRAGIPALTGLTGNALRDAIRAERVMELACEGDRFNNLKRMRMSIGNPVGTEAPLAWNSSRLIFKIPDTEMSANSEAEQNP
jgi:starch-binding outer membrane protein, SusD/RagB family